jgi:membrane dipeptidase
MRVLGAALVVAALSPLPVRGAEVEPSPVPAVDLHVDLSYRMNYQGGTLRRGSGQFVASKLARAGVVGVVLPLFVPHRVSPTGPRAADLEASVSRLLKVLPRTPPYSVPGCDGASGTVRTWLAFEGAAPLAGDPDAMARWTARGVRLFGLVHTSDNALATSSGSRADPTHGLTDAGRELVSRVHAARGVVDVSHASDRATDEVLRLAAAEGVPVVATHSNARALTPHPRNLTDEQIRAIARTGGVVGINFHSRFLVSEGRAQLSDVVKHIRHVEKVGGIDHVALGSDFEGDIRPPAGLASVSALPALSRALEASGMSRGDVEKVFSRNALRVLCPRVPSAKN